MCWQLTRLGVQARAHFLKPLHAISRVSVHGLIARFGQIELADVHCKPRSPDEQIVFALH
jgi:hypothetical protein